MYGAKDAPGWARRILQHLMDYDSIDGRVVERKMKIVASFEDNLRLHQITAAKNKTFVNEVFECNKQFTCSTCMLLKPVKCVLNRFQPLFVVSRMTNLYLRMTFKWENLMPP